MNLIPEQQAVLMALTTKWETSTQIAERIPEKWRDISSINQSLKDLVHEGLVQTNSVVFGLYRLTMNGTTIKDLQLKENQ